MNRVLRRKIFFSWVAGLICGILAEEIVQKSLEFSIIFGAIIAIVLTVYFIAEHYGLFKLIKKEIESWGNESSQ